MSDLESQPIPQTELLGGNSGKPPRPTAVGVEDPEPESESIPLSLMQRFFAWLASQLLGVHPEIPHACDEEERSQKFAKGTADD